MKWWNKVPVSLRKQAGDVIEAPIKWQGEDPQHSSDLSLVAGRIADNVRAVLDFVADSDLPPGEQAAVREAVENAIVEFAGSMIRIEEMLGEKMEQSPKDGAILELPQTDSE